MHDLLVSVVMQWKKGGKIRENTDKNMGFFLYTGPYPDVDYFKIYYGVPPTDKKYQKGYRSIRNRINVQNINF